MRLASRSLILPSAPARPARFCSVTALSSIQNQTRHLLTLAIETSCDDTAVAVVEKNGATAKLHFNERVTAFQGPLKGIHPIIALESHEGTLAGLVQHALHHLPAVSEQDSASCRSLTLTDSHGHTIARKLPDFVSVTRGPGMRSNLNAGLNVAKGLAVAWQLPLIGVHHMQAHALTPRLALSLASGGGEGPKPDFPFLSLLVSGGHTLLVRSLDLVTHQIVVNTADYAIGDCLDKVAKTILPEELLQSSVSYGPVLEKFAFPNGEKDYAYSPPTSLRQEIRYSKLSTRYGWYVPLPFATAPPGRKQEVLQFSFTGIESHAAKISRVHWDADIGKFSKTPRSMPTPKAEAQLLAREVMRVSFEHIASRIAQVLEEDAAVGRPVTQTLVLSGGVASNQFLRHVLRSYLAARRIPIKEIIAPPISLCTDNAAMIGWTGCEMFEAGYRDSLGIRGLGKWSLENVLCPEKEKDARGWLENNVKPDTSQ